MPTVVPFKQIGCYIQYHKLFSDDLGNIYLEFWTMDNFMQVLLLVDCVMVVLIALIVC